MGIETLALIGAGVGGATGAGIGLGTLGTVGLAGLGGLAGLQMGMSQEQQKLDIATIEANREEAKLAASEKALMNARGFRRALSNQMAMANFRGGPGSSLASQFGTDSMASFLADQKAIERSGLQADTAASMSLGQAGMSRRARDLNTFGSFGSTVFGAMNFSGGGGAPAGGASAGGAPAGGK